MQKGEWRREVENDTGLAPVHRLACNNHPREAKEARNMFYDYFHSEVGNVH